MAAFQKDIASGYWEEKYKVTDSEDSKLKSKVTASKVTKQSSELVDWFKNYYTLSKAGNIVVLSYKRTQKRAYYPVLFKKICIYCILAVQLKYNSRNSLSNAKFFEEFGIGENILNKWHVSTRYLFLANRDTYSALRIDRNGVKKPYLTRIIKKVYYESGNQIKKYLDTAKKYELETFVDEIEQIAELKMMKGKQESAKLAQSVSEERNMADSVFGEIPEISDGDVPEDVMAFLEDL